MKKILFLSGILAIIVMVSACTKERTCRCSVLHQQTVRIFKIDKGSCEDVFSILYDQDPILYPDVTDSVLCTDFDFDS